MSEEDLVEATLGIEVDLPERASFERKRRIISEQLGIDPDHIASVEAI